MFFREHNRLLRASLLILMTLFVQSVFAQDAQRQAEPAREVPSLEVLLDPPRDAGPSLAAVANDLLSMKIESDHETFGIWKGVVVKVTNNTQRTVVCNGEAATIGGVTNRVSALSIAKMATRMIDSENPRGKYWRNFKDTVTATASIGAVQTVKDQLVQSGPVLARYGWDERRRQTELKLFGKRVLYPGESTTGSIYFGTTLPAARFTLEMPLYELYNEKDACVVSASREPLGTK